MWGPAPQSFQQRATHGNKSCSLDAPRGPVAVSQVYAVGREILIAEKNKRKKGGLFGSTSRTPESKGGRRLFLLRWKGPRRRRPRSPRSTASLPGDWDAQREPQPVN